MCFSEPDTVGVKVKRAVSKEKANKGICFRHQSIYYVVFVYPVSKIYFIYRTRSFKKHYKDCTS